MKLPHASSSDPLLFATSILLYLVCAFLILAITSLCIALPVVGIYWTDIAAEIVKDYPKASTAGLMPAIMSAIALGISMAMLAFAFVNKLLEIIRTVGEGDPFDAANADRLQKMAWLSLAIQVVGMFLGGVVIWVSGTIKEMDVHYESGGFNSIILILLLFILARVFRRGADMRSELEGTV